MIDVRQLEAFRAVIDNRSATRAAAALGVTQPAVSGLIAKLERQVGFALFRRKRGRLEPTPEGHLFYAEVSQTLSSLDRLTQATLDIRQAQAGRLAIASNPGTAISLLPAVAAQFVRERPGVTVRLITRSSQLVKELIPAQAFDIGIAELPIDSTMVEVEKFRLRCVAALPEDHSLAAAEAVTPSLLDGQPFIAMFREHMTFHSLAKAFAEAGARWNVCAEAEFFASAGALVAGGAGVAVIDPFTAIDFEGRGVVCRPFDPVIPYEIAMFRPAHREPSLLAADFANAVKRRLEPFL